MGMNLRSGTSYISKVLTITSTLNQRVTTVKDRSLFMMMGEREDLVQEKQISGVNSRDGMDILTTCAMQQKHTEIIVIQEQNIAILKTKSNLLFWLPTVTSCVEVPCGTACFKMDLHTPLFSVTDEKYKPNNRRA